MLIRNLLFVLLLITSSQIFAQDDLDNYIKRLRQSEASGGKETAFMSAGSGFLYGQGYFDSKQYDLAAMYFSEALGKEANNPYFNYQLAISLLRQKNEYKAQQAQAYLKQAFELNPNLKARYAADMPAANNTAQPSNTSIKKIKSDGLETYLEELKYSRATGGKKTVMNSPCLDVMYGYDYYTRGEYASAERHFRYAVTKQEDDVYANYLLGTVLSAQGNSGEATGYLNKAFTGDPQLKSRYAKEVAAAKEIYQKKENAKNPVARPAVKEKIGGPLTIGNYVCRQTVWNGPNANPQFSFKDQGYFSLKADGTYRWLDNGATGRYSYDHQTGSIKWLSGYLAGFTIKSAEFKPGEKVSSISINFSDTYRWGCGCNK